MRETEIKLDARQIAMSLLPTGEQHLDGLEVGGFSYASKPWGLLRFSPFYPEGGLQVVVGMRGGHDLADPGFANSAYLRLCRFPDDLLSDVFTRLNNALVDAADAAEAVRHDVLCG
ncbi:MAG: hypothetical protein R3C12_25785 [Planctomycetaceae bacterium]